MLQWGCNYTSKKCCVQPAPLLECPCCLFPLIWFLGPVDTCSQVYVFVSALGKSHFLCISVDLGLNSPSSSMLLQKCHQIIIGFTMI